MINKRVLVLAFKLVSLLVVVSVSAHAVGYSVDVFDGSTPVIDGEMAPSEWNDAATLSFNFTTVHLKHDANNLYIAFNISDATLDSDFEGAYIGLDTSNDGGPSLNQSDDIIIGTYRNGTAFETDGMAPLPPSPGWNVSVFEEAMGYTIEFNITYGRIGITSSENKTLGLLLLSYDQSAFQYSIWPIMDMMNVSNPSNWGDMMVVFQTGPIYIKPDGSIEGTDKIVSMDNITYTFTSDINASIVVQRSNIVIDGEGWTLDGLNFAIWEGFNLTAVTNVTIINVNIERFASYSIYLESASQCVISRNNMSGSEGGIGLFSSAANIVSKNMITACSEAVELAYSSGNNISWNTIWDSASGVYLFNSTDNTITGNNLTENWSRGIQLGYFSNNNSVSENNVTNTRYSGITISGSHNNTISNNILVNNTDAVSAVGSSFTTITGNIMVENRQNGISFDNAGYNNVSRNEIKASSLNGIFVEGEESKGNLFYHNNIVDNTNPVEVQMGLYGYPLNTWDNGIEGNYWSDYSGVDVDGGGDGLGDSPYVMDVNNTDNHPLMGPVTFFDAGTWNEKAYYVHTVSNSTTSDFNFNVTSQLVTFNVTGPDGILGFCRVAIPRELLWCSDIFDWTVRVNGTPAVPLRIQEHAEDTYLYFTYSHSVQTVEVYGTQVIPEFLSLIILVFFMTATLLATTVYKRKGPLKT